MTTKPFESQISRHPNHLNSESVDNQNHWNLKSYDNPIIWISSHSTSKSFEFRSIDNQNHIWISNQSTSKSLEFRINWQPKPFESQIIRRPNHLNSESIDNQNQWNLKSDDNQITWIPNQMTTKPFDSQFTWIWHQLIFDPIELHTPLPIGSLSLETSATALCGRYVIYISRRLWGISNISLGSAWGIGTRDAKRASGPFFAPLPHDWFHACGHCPNH